MFKIVIADSRMWKNLMAAISTLVEEATFDITPEGISLRAMDPSHVAMVDFEYPKEAFQEYSCSEPSKPLCVDIADMVKLMRRVESGETLELSLDPDTNKLLMKLSGKYTRRFSIPQLQPSTTEKTPTPKLEFDANIKMDAGCLNDAVTDMAAVSEQVKFEANTDKLVMTGLSETGDIIVEFEKDNTSIVSFNVKREVKALYGVSILQDMVKAGTASSNLATVEFSTDKPIRIDFELPLQGKLTYHLAPRIE